MTQRQRNARDIRNEWMRTARHWQELGVPFKVKHSVAMARRWSHELVRRKVGMS